MLGRKSSVEISFSGSYIGRSILGYAITSPNWSTNRARIHGGIAMNERARFWMVTVGSTALTMVVVSEAKSSVTGAGRADTVRVVTRSEKESRRAVLKRAAVGLSVAPRVGRTVEPGVSSVKSGLLGNWATAA